VTVECRIARIGMFFHFCLCPNVTFDSLSCSFTSTSFTFYIFLVQFTSHNCDEAPRRLTESKYYILSWNGQITPHLCSFSFTGGNQNQHGITKRSYRSRSYRPRKHYEVCFESVVYDLPYTMGNVKLSIANYTRSEWVCETSLYIDICLVAFKPNVLNVFYLHRLPIVLLSYEL
jgi:hypothetical protein